jgi:hypothetical protein
LCSDLKTVDININRGLSNGETGARAQVWPHAVIQIQLQDLRTSRFPHGKHDDIVDALGLAGQLLDKVWKPQKPLPDPEQKEFDDYEIKKNDLLNSSFMTI